MKTITTTTNIYKFHELSEEAKKHALDKNRDINVSYNDWWDSEEDYFIENMENFGFKVDKIYFSGFWSQGDGACFIGSVKVYDYLRCNKKLSKFKSLHKIIKEENIIISITHSGNYYHANSMDFEEDSFYLSKPLTEKQEKELDFVFEEIKIFAKQQANKLYDNLQKKQYDYLTSDEAILETIEANDYDFTKDGEMY